MTKHLKDFPFDIQISFHKIIEQYEDELKEIEGGISKEYMEKMLENIADYHQLTEGFDDPERLE